MYPCVILSRCFWQHTSEIHSEGALITAGLRFPPFMCPAETFSPRQQRLSIQPRRRLLLPLAAPAAGAVNKRWLSLFWLWANEVRASDKDANYVMTSRTNTRRWVQQGSGEEDGTGRRSAAASRRRSDARTGGHEAAAGRTLCVPIRRTILLSPHTLLVPGHITPPTGCIILRSHPVGVTVQGRAGLQWYAVISPVPPRCSSSKISASLLPARPLSSNARGLERKLELADRKSLIRFFSPSVL